jgi:hypothetical protein
VLLALSTFQLRMRPTWKWAQGHTGSVEIRATLEEEFHNLDVAIERRIMQRPSFVLVYGPVKNEGD